jgi:hypothetical protein
MKSTLLIVEGDGELPIAREEVRLVISKQMVDVPDEVAEWRDAIAREQDRIRESGREPMWNGSGYAVDYVSVSASRMSRTPPPGRLCCLLAATAGWMMLRCRG